MAAPRSYEIRLFDQALVAFSISDGIFGPEVKLQDYDDTAAALMPCGLEPTGGGVWRWLEIRSIPTNRKNAALICRELGFELGDLEALYRASLGLSLNDSYWVVPKGFDGTFDEFNLYDNAFSEAIGALSVAGEARSATPHGNTPELTTDGTLRKGWRIVNDKRVLYKGATSGYTPGEPISEYVCSLIATDLHLNAVKYGIDTWQDELCSTCENFASKSISYVPFSVATGHSTLVDALRWCAAAGDSYLAAICDMFTFDALVCNTDRHLTNFGILRDNATGAPCGMAPIFDNGRGLFPNVADDDANQFALEAELCGPAFGARSFCELISRIKGPEQTHLLNTASARGIVGNTQAPTRRIAALDAFLRNRAETLAALPEVDIEELKCALEATAPLGTDASENVFRLR